jgi:two-component system response regulator PrrA
MDKLRILLAEDDEESRRLLSRALAVDGFEVAAFGNARVVFELLRDSSGDERAMFDLVIADVCMPEMSGIDLVRVLRARSPTVPVILMSGIDDERTTSEASALGVAAFFVKPFDLDDLRTVVRYHVRTIPPRSSARPSGP